MQSFCTIEDLYARYDRRALEWYASNEVQVLVVPEPPEAIRRLTDSAIRFRAIEVWDATNRLVHAIDLWKGWFHTLQKEGDAHPGLALWNQETCIKCVEAIAHRVNAPPFNCESENRIIRKLPLIPGWSMGGTDIDLDENHKPIQKRRVRWQEDPDLFSSYYGLEGRCRTANELRGQAFGLLTMLTEFPVAACQRKARSTPTIWIMPNQSRRQIQLRPQPVGS